MKLLNLKLETIPEELRCRLIVLHLRLLQFVYKRHPIPLIYWLKFWDLLKIILRSTDPLFPPSKLLVSTGAQLKEPELQRILWKDTLGLWALDRASIELLWQRIQLDHPNVIVECGSGISTMVLAKYVALSCSGSIDHPLVLSIEQDVHIKQAAENRLVEHGLGDHVQIVHMPISEQGKYEFDANRLYECLGSKKIDLLIIDGPSGPEGCRVWTLPQLARFCRPRARWFLDDAFRDGELGILRRWSHVPGIEIDGIYPVGKGLATGVVKDPQKVLLL